MCVSAEKSFLGKTRVFDVILGIILCSVLSRVINGRAGFFHTIAAGAVLTSLHRFLAFAAFHSERFGTVVKGKKRKLVENGKNIRDNMRKSYISENYSTAAILGNADTDDLKWVKVA